MSVFGELIFWIGVAFGAVLGFGVCTIIVGSVA
jgi:hypothetical protein